MKTRTAVISFAAAAAVCAAFPFFVDAESSYAVYLMFLAFTYIGLAQGWNIVGGYTGQVSLGQHAFFGIGGYVTAILWIRGITGYLDPIAMLLSGLAAVVLAVAVGFPLLSKLRGDYFALGTLGLAEILRTICIQGGELTGGTVGLVLPSGAYSSILPYYFIALSLAAFATLVTYLVARSRVGLALVAIREDETAASFNGIFILRYKVLAFALGAFLTALCGSLQAYYIFHVHPSGFFGLNWTLYPILMCLLGGGGTLAGPIIGALFLAWVFELSKVWLVEIHPLFSGTLIILVMLFLPDGVIRIRLKRRKRKMQSGR